MTAADDRYPYPVAQIGIIGGGQLGRMLVAAAKRIGCTCTVLDPYPNSPAGQLSGEQIVGTYHDPAALKELVAACDVTTFDIEDIDTETLGDLSAVGHRIFPCPGLLADIQDKLRQKQVLADAGIPSAEFAPAEQPDADAFGAFG
ncbi:MAG: 5-(carboxyamino)imidazole ribonucleotide synthase, partial [Thiohalocapsa sp.]